MCILRFTAGYTAYVISIYLPLQTGEHWKSNRTSGSAICSMFSSCSHRHLRCCCCNNGLHLSTYWQSAHWASVVKHWQEKGKRKKYLWLRALEPTLIPPWHLATEGSLTDSPDPSILVGWPVRLNPNQAEWQAPRISLYLLDCTQSMENTDLHCQSLTPC